MKKTRIALLCLGGASLLPFFAGAALAQDSNAPAVHKKKDSDGTVEVIVTAARRSQNIQKVSSAVQVVSGEKLTDQGLANVQEVVAEMPSVQATGQPGGVSIDIRGQGGDLPSGSTQGSTALEFDGVYNISTQGTTVGFFDVDRIEVLPGPQSTRYGPDADGGVVNVITRDPKLNSWSGDGSLTLGNYGEVRTEIAQNIPLGDKAALRISEATLNRSSYFTDPTEGNVRAQSVRAKLLYKPSDKLTLKLSVQTDHLGGTGDGSNAFPIFIDKVQFYSGDSINNLSNPWKGTGGQDINNTVANIRQNTVTGSANWEINDAVGLDLLSSYITMSGHETGCGDAPPWLINGFFICGASLHEFAPFHQMSTELRLHNGPGSKLIWNLGLYHWDYFEESWATGAAFLSSPPTHTSTATNAVYGEVTYPVTDTFRLIGGLRKSFDKRVLDFNNSGVATQDFTYTMNHGDYRLGAEYDVTKTSMAYVTVSTGYRPGGLTDYSPLTNSPTAFAPEVNTAYEAGIKNRFFDNRLLLNADIYVYKQSGYQVLDSYGNFEATLPGGSTVECTTQTANLYPECSVPTFNLKAHAEGLETQARYRVTDDDTLAFTGTFMNAAFDKNQSACAVKGISSSTIGYDGPNACYYGYSDYETGSVLKIFDIAGKVQPHSPKFSGNINYDHRFQFDSGTLTVGGNVFYSTSYWVHPVQDDEKYGFQPAYWLEGANISYVPAKGNWSINAYVHNISDYAVKLSVLPATSLGDPRTFGLVLSEKW